MGHLAPLTAEAATACPERRPQAWAEGRYEGLEGKCAGAHAPRKEALARSESSADDAVLLAQVRGGITLARARAPGSSDVAERDSGFLQRRLEPVPDRSPRTHVLRLLLRPHDFAQVRVAGDELRIGVDGERIKVAEPSPTHARPLPPRALSSPPALR